MRKNRLILISICLVLLISMSVGFVACKKTPSLVGTWEQQYLDTSNATKTSTIIFENKNNETVLVKYDLVMVQSMKVVYDKKEKIYKLVDSRLDLT